MSYSNYSDELEKCAMGPVEWAGTDYMVEKQAGLFDFVSGLGEGNKVDPKNIGSGIESSGKKQGGKGAGTKSKNNPKVNNKEGKGFIDSVKNTAKKGYGWVKANPLKAGAGAAGVAGLGYLGYKALQDNNKPVEFQEAPAIPADIPSVEPAADQFPQSNYPGAY